MSEIIFERGNQELLEIIKPLWESLNEQHRQTSRYFQDVYNHITFEKRKQALIEKSKDSEFLVELVRQADHYIGYCVSTVNKEKVGEIETIFILESFRGDGIGDRLMKNALKWMDDLLVERKTINVVYGNDRALSFYSRYGFYPRSYTLNQVDNKNLSENIG